jgi:hypothetical protein
VSDPLAKEIKGNPKNQNCSTDASHGAEGTSISVLGDPRICIEREQKPESGYIRMVSLGATKEGKGRNLHLKPSCDTTISPATGL